MDDVVGLMRTAVRVSERFGRVAAISVGCGALVVSTAIVGHFTHTDDCRYQLLRWMTTFGALFGGRSVFMRASSARPAPVLAITAWWISVSLAVVVVPVASLVGQPVGWARFAVALALLGLGVLEIPLCCLACGLVGPGAEFSLPAR